MDSAWTLVIWHLRPLLPANVIVVFPIPVAEHIPVPDEQVRTLSHHIDVGARTFAATTAAFIHEVLRRNQFRVRIEPATGGIRRKSSELILIPKLLMLSIGLP